MVKYVSWIFSGFYLELNVCALNLNVIQIQTKLQNYIQNICETLTSNSGLNLL
jgi:hypothetical protein